MKSIYIMMLAVLVIVMAVAVLYITRKEKKFVANIVRLLVCGIISSIAYCFFLKSTNAGYALFWDGLYFFMCDVLSYYMIQFIEEYTDVKSKMPIMKKILIGLIAIDGMGLLLNNYFHWMFSLETCIYQNGSFQYYTEVFTPIHYLHLALCYVMIAYSMGVLIYKTFTTAKIYKLKYIVVFIPFAVLIVINAICYSQSLPVDASVVLYGVLACIICFCTYALVPNRLVLNAQAYVMDNASMGVLCYNNKNECIFINQAIKEIIEHKGNDIDYDRQIKEFFANKSQEFRDNNISEKQIEEKVDTEDGERYLQFSYQSFTDNNGKYVGSFFIVEDKTDAIKEKAENKYKANHDILTGLYNKSRFFAEADRIISENPEEKKWLIVSDIKDFKLINNIYGKEYGDELLKMQANLIKKNLKDDSICARIAGDKFAMLIQRENFSIDIFKSAVEQLQVHTMEKKYKICYHIGMYDITGLTDTAEKLYNRVNMAIASIHNDYDKIFVECTSDVIGKILEEKNMITDIEEAIAGRQFKMYLQPQVYRDGSIVGAEALVRWQHPTKGLIFPDSFIGVFEKAGIIHKLDLNIWEQAAEKLAEWKKQGNEHTHISINISTKDFYYLDIYAELTRIVEEYNIDPKLLKLEITESVLMVDKNDGFSTIARLREYGFEVEIDDFGSGYSSLNMLKEFNVDVLKIDRMFLKETEDKERSRIILNAVITLAKDMGMDVVTEGVENLSQVNSLKEMGCDIFQGYYFDKPLSVEQFEQKYM